MERTNASIEAATASLVREYLSRKGFKETLAKMDEECPRNELSISNRQTLMKHVHLDKLMKKNKEEIEPLKAMLEIMTKFFVERRLQNQSDRCSANQSNFDVNFSPQVDQPFQNNTSSVSSTSRPHTNGYSTKKDKNDLVMDDDVEGETVIGVGMAGIMSINESESPPPQYSTKNVLARPVSAKQRFSMISNNDDILTGRNRMQQPKPLRLSVSQKEQQKKDSLSNSINSSPEFFYDALRSNSGINIEEKPKKTESSPLSFEDLLMKGEEKANRLQRIGLENKIKDTIGEEKPYKVETSSIFAGKSKPALNNNNFTKGASLNSPKTTELELGDIDDMESDLTDLNLKPAAPVGPKQLKLVKVPSTPMDLKTAMALKNLMLGSPCQLYIDEWLQQGYSFCDLPDLKYGIVQKKGGPCGVLAAVQACLLQEMLFGDSKLPSSRFKNPTRAERSKYLALALSNIFWRAGDFARAVVTVPSETSHILSSTKFKQDGVTEQLSIYTFTSFDTLSSFMQQSISEFETEGKPGVILTIYSAMLSRKCPQVRGDFDEPEQSTLIGSHGYCTQELVNLLLTGRAVSNVFNDQEQLEGTGVGDTIILKGISGRSDIGLLSLFEHYQSCKVGTYYKTPKNPIWVVCSESHFSVLFAAKRDLVNDWKAERRFDLFYYDGLSRQQEEIRLTISTLNQAYKPPVSEDDLVPPLEHCIRTKWPDAEIDWNGYEPIL
ncbi:probable ubiquitin carboxyl-terminal hydrolase MINDY-4 isoform X2 [Physella acuta]|uniref:probable ubiquitin carboxyl-terminal hydrolase MINDY-4 isoform X2 n=1 Tax=Physella acuta TaxID=109671 RepID=UPI0027DD6D32|nr:probable ubiquitin carboxyl-terminal hydrolase MINDY-4 isoform X2 [Physella acuta]